VKAKPAALRWSSASGTLGALRKNSTEVIKEDKIGEPSIGHRKNLKLPEVPLKRDRESSKCKVFIPFYCSSLAIPVRLRRTTGNALAGAFSISSLCNLCVFCGNWLGAD
jgi:hypothetical protein